ncbi:hypothetical protein [Streptomyces sp. NPDC058545]|uniref:hypothetical protein n=1 Tax=Streptomyces sp. NPDC058545 TaxID=3346544 RepID=UPI00365000EF
MTGRHRHGKPGNQALVAHITGDQSHAKTFRRPRRGPPARRDEVKTDNWPLSTGC